MAADLPQIDIEGSIFERFRQVARAHRDRPAVRERGGVVTYGELEASADAVAAALAARLGAAPGPVVLFVEAGGALLAAMLGVLRAGRFYVHLDPRLPPARLEAIWHGLGAAALIADAASFDRGRDLAGGGAPAWHLEELTAASEASGAPPAVRPDDLAYVLFTSGSTGTPKGVMHCHRNVLHNVRRLAKALSLTPEDRLTLLSSPGFGAGASDIFGAFLTGAAVCPISMAGEGLRRLPESLEREGITVFHSVPTVFRSFWSTLDGSTDLSRVRVVRLGGEPVLASDFQLYRNRFSTRCRFHVGLGATEVGVVRDWSAGHDTVWPGGTPLGYPLDETEVVLLDDAGRAGSEEGEIAVIARTLAVGYWKDPAATAAAFEVVPGRPGFRRFRTGDLGRMLPDGCLLFAGRKDARLKIRGHRVETLEVEAALLEVPGIREAAVGGRSRPDGTQLVAWLACRGEDRPGIGDLRLALARRLPEFMVPSVFVFLEALPRTATGKVDRDVLPDPAGERPSLSAAFVEPRDEAEALAASGFERALGLDRVGADDDFFELGGDSLSAVELLTGLSDAFGAELSVADLLESPTPAGMARRARRGSVDTRKLVRLSEGTGSPVFVVPGGGGDGEDLFSARRLARLTDGGSAFYAFRSGPPPHPPIEELASRCVEELRSIAPRGPYRLIGDCVGGILAVAIARRLRELGEPIDLLALVDTPFPSPGRRLRARISSRAPWLPGLVERIRYFRNRARHHAEVLFALRRGRLDYALRIAGVGARGLVEPEAARRPEARDRRASYVGKLLSWRPEPFDGTIHRIETDEARRRGFGEGWDRIAAPGQVVRIPGSHLSMIVDHGDRVAAALSSWLAGGQEPGGGR